MKPCWWTRLDARRIREMPWPKLSPFAVTDNTSVCFPNMRNRSVTSLGTVDILGRQREPHQQALCMAGGARCYSARAGKLEDALAYAARVREAGELLDDRLVQAWRAME